MTRRILIPDSLHINIKNFTSFFNFTKQNNIELVFRNDFRELIAAYGNYEIEEIALNKAKILEQLNKDDLFNFTVEGVNLFEVSRAELLSKLIVSPTWFDERIPDTKKEVFLKAYELNLKCLIANMAIAWHWLEHWTSYLKTSPKFSHCCIFSGSLIYQKSLIEVLKKTQTKAIIMEHSFTGNDYYCEEKYTPIANNSDIKHDAVYSSIPLPTNQDAYERERNKAINKIILQKNKNVTHPTEWNKILLDKNRKTILILGQVVNDFSLLESKDCGISSIAFYKELISELVKLDVNIIFKAHPWEEKKINIKSDLTKRTLEEFVNNFSLEQRKHIHIIDHYPLDVLFKETDYVIGLNSQSMIEAAFHGLKPIQFGEAFFGNRGFTYDEDLREIPEFMHKLTSHRGISGRLSLDEFIKFEEFCIKFFQNHLVSIHSSGLENLNRILSLPKIIPILSREAASKKGIVEGLERVKKKKKPFLLKLYSFLKKFVLRIKANFYVFLTQILKKLKSLLFKVLKALKLIGNNNKKTTNNILIIKVEDCILNKE